MILRTFFLIFILTLANATCAFADDSSSKIEKIKQRIAHYTPESVAEAPIELKHLKFDELRNTKLPFSADGFGQEGIVRFGEYKGQPVAVKFYKRSAMILQSPTHQVAQGVLDAKIKQGYFLLDVVSELNLAPKPYAYSIGENLKTALTRASIPHPERFYGAIVMQRINPDFHPKSFVAKQKLAPIFDTHIEAEIERAAETINSVGLHPHDLDYMVDRNSRFYFVDLDYWGIKTDHGYYRHGERKFFYEPKCPMNATQLLKIIFDDQ